MSVFQCMTWLPVLFGDILNLLTPNNNGVDDSTASFLPDAIIIDILKKLPLDRAIQCALASKPIRDLMSTPSIITTQHSRSTPSIVLYWKQRSLTFDKDSKSHWLPLSLHFVDQFNKLVETTIAFHRPYVIPPLLIGSYNGLLLFRQMGDEVLHIYNPITQEYQLVHNPRPLLIDLLACTLYYHTPSNEYRVLYVSSTKVNGLFHFFSYSLRSKVVREISTYDVAPCTCRDCSSPVFLHGAFHWMGTVLDEASHFCRYATCSKFIFGFKTDSEDFFTMGIPPDECDRCAYSHDVMQLCDMEGELCICSLSLSAVDIHVWVMDYSKPLWLRRYVITISEMKLHYHYPEGYHCSQFIKVAHIHSNKLYLIRLCCRDIYVFDLTGISYQRVASDTSPQIIMSICTHKNSLASVYTTSGMDRATPYLGS